MNRWAIAGIGFTGGLLAALVSAWPLDTHPLVMGWFGPPVVQMTERHAAGGTASFSHEGFDVVLRAHVRDGLVDYAGLAADPGPLKAYVDSLATAPFAELSRDGKLALLINAYNAATLQLMVEHWPVASIRDIPEDQRWDAVRWTIGGRTLSLTQIEHQELREGFVEPRVHFAINCASLGCPPLRDEAFTESGLESALEAATLAVHTDPRWLRIEGGTVHLTRIHLWYKADFERAGGSIPFAARYQPALGSGEWTIVWLPYDWKANTVP